jgi:hypothetical protein
MTRSRSVTFQRAPLSAGVLTPVTPERSSTGVVVVNGTPGDVEVHSNDEDDGHYIIIAAGFERTLPKLHDNGTNYTETKAAFWLRATQDGTVMLLWT